VGAASLGGFAIITTDASKSVVEIHDRICRSSSGGGIMPGGWVTRAILVI
jgi:hypothetical protein